MGDGHRIFSQRLVTLSPEQTGYDGDPSGIAGDPSGNDGDPSGNDGDPSVGDPSKLDSTNCLCVTPESTDSVHPEGVVSGTSEVDVALDSSCMEREEFVASEVGVAMTASGDEKEGLLKVSSQCTSETEFSELDPFISGSQNNMEPLAQGGDTLGYINPIENVDPLTHVDPLEHVDVSANIDISGPLLVAASHGNIDISGPLLMAASHGNIDISGPLLMTASHGTDITGNEESLCQASAEDSDADLICHTSPLADTEELPAGSHFQCDITEVVEEAVSQPESVLYTNS